MTEHPIYFEALNHGRSYRVFDDRMQPLIDSTSSVIRPVCKLLADLGADSTDIAVFKCTDGSPSMTAPVGSYAQ